jgi:hypothetical protein
LKRANPSTFNPIAFVFLIELSAICNRFKKGAARSVSDAFGTFKQQKWIHNFLNCHLFSG